MSKFESSELLGKQIKRLVESSPFIEAVQPEEIPPQQNLDSLNENFQDKTVDGIIAMELDKTGATTLVCNVCQEHSNVRDDSAIEEKEQIEEDDHFGVDNEEESSGLFDNTVKSIFIRKSSGLESTDDLSTRVIKTDLANGGKNEARQKVKKTPRKLERKHAISFVDTLLSLFVVGPLVIGQWRGIWTMMDIYDEYFSEWLCFIAGTGLHVLFAIGRDGLHGRFVEKLRINHGAAGRIAYDLVRLLYIYIFCIACNAHWRGGWKIFNRYCGTNIWISTLFTIIFAAGLVILRSFRNLLAPPFIVVIDQPERVFHFPTRYNVEKTVWRGKLEKTGENCENFVTLRK